MGIFSRKKENFREVEVEGRIFAEVCKSDEISEGKGRKIEFPEDIDMQVAVFRLEGKLFALQNICPHRHADRIHEGIIRNGNVTCPLHGWTYEVKSGRNINIRQGRKSLIKYDVFEDNGSVYVEKPSIEAIPKWRR